MLDELPESLDETYERILRDINKANRDHAHRLLQCLTVAVRPLRVAELAEVLAVDFGRAARGGTPKLKMGWRWEDQEGAVLSTCSSLISIMGEDDSQVVQFSHFSVKEFLTSTRLASSSVDVSRFHIFLEPAHTILAKACLGVLIQLDDRHNRGNVQSSFPLARYAAKYWVDHAQFENVSSHIWAEMETLFDPCQPYFSAWLYVYDIDTEPHDDQTLFYFAKIYRDTRGTPLYYAALCGFHDLVEHLIVNHAQDANASGGYYLSPLGAALGNEHLDIAQVLYHHGADVDVWGYFRRTPLDSASCAGHLEITQWLLGRDANPDVCDDNAWTPLHSASISGHLEVAQILFQHKAHNNTQDNKGQIPLHVASLHGHLHVVRLLLEHDGDVKAQNEERSTPLHLALNMGHLEVARLLIEYGANGDVVDWVHGTPIQVASEKGYHDIVKLLSGHSSMSSALATSTANEA